MKKAPIRPTVWGLMVLVAIRGVGIAALRYPSKRVANTLFTAPIALLTVAILGVLGRRERQRGYWAGFARSGWMYALLSLAPWIRCSHRPSSGHDGPARHPVSARGPALTATGPAESDDDVRWLALPRAARPLDDLDQDRGQPRFAEVGRIDDPVQQ
ncbi:MAG TPA: hypothetical protein VF590_10280 [Isosphaeraceae bacterium]|jgi:hypothetical protein